jgi:hypothetical protein
MAPIKLTVTQSTVHCFCKVSFCWSQDLALRKTTGKWEPSSEASLNFALAAGC